jgi:hypothetical protein
MTEGEIETLVLHEEGELRRRPPARRRLAGNAGGLGGKRAEIFARAVKDNLADCLVTLPALLRARRRDSLHFWFATFDGLRREMFPRCWRPMAQESALAIRRFWPPPRPRAGAFRRAGQAPAGNGRERHRGALARGRQHRPVGSRSHNGRLIP